MERSSSFWIKLQFFSKLFCWKFSDALCAFGVPARAFRESQNFRFVMEQIHTGERHFQPSNFATSILSIYWKTACPIFLSLSQRVLCAQSLLLRKEQCVNFSIAAGLHWHSRHQDGALTAKSDVAKKSSPVEVRCDPPALARRLARAYSSASGWRLPPSLQKLLRASGRDQSWQAVRQSTASAQSTTFHFRSRQRANLGQGERQSSSAHFASKRGLLTEASLIWPCSLWSALRDAGPRLCQRVELDDATLMQLPLALLAAAALLQVYKRFKNSNHG